MTLDLTAKKPAENGPRLSADIRDAYTLIETAVNAALADIAAKADKTYADSLMPVGTGPFPCMQPTPPTGFIFFDGGTYSRATYAALIAWALAQNLVGTGKPFGVGDGSTTFTTADLGGMGLMGYKSTDSDFNAIGKTGGVKEVTLSATQSGVAAHSHSGTVSHTHTASSGGRSAAHTHSSTFSKTLDGIPYGFENGPYYVGRVLVSGATGDYVTVTSGTESADHNHAISVSTDAPALSIASAAVAAASAHSNLQPYFTVNWMVKT
jgi:microcystin-dependent protein